MTRAPGRPAGVKALAVIRIALMLGVLFFGALAWWLHGRPTWTPPDPRALRGVRRFVLMSWIAVSVLLIFFRLRLERARTEAQRHTTLIVAWAVAEAAAMGGAVDFLLTRDTTMFAGGVFVLAAAFVLFPIRR